MIPPASPPPYPPRPTPQDVQNEKIRQKLMSKESWEKFLFNTPCVKSSYLWGVGIGSLVLAHKLRLYPGKLRHSFNAALFTFIFTSTASFILCSTEVNYKYQQLQKAFLSQQKPENVPERKTAAPPKE